MQFSLAHNARLPLSQISPEKLRNLAILPITSKFYVCSSLSWKKTVHHPSRDEEFILFADFEQEVKERKVADVPNGFVDDSGKLNKHAQAYFGLFKHLFDAEFLNDKALDNDKLVALAFSIDDVVNTAVAEYSINPAEIENAIHMKLLPLLFADLGLDNAQKLIEEVLKITRLGLARG